MCIVCRKCCRNRPESTGIALCVSDLLQSLYSLLYFASLCSCVPCVAVVYLRAVFQATQNQWTSNDRALPTLASTKWTTNQPTVRIQWNETHAAGDVPISNTTWHCWDRSVDLFTIPELTGRGLAPLGEESWHKPNFKKGVAKYQFSLPFSCL